MSAPEGITMEDEDKLVKAAVDGDPGAFDELLEHHLPRLFAVCLKLTGRREDAEDCLQEASIRLYRSLSLFRGDARFSTWASRIAMNCCYDFLRKRKGNREVGLELETDEGSVERILIDPSPRQDEVIEQEEQADLVRQAAFSVREPFRSVLIEIDLLGHSYEEVAKKEGVALGTIKSRLSRARGLAGEFLQKRLGTNANVDSSKKGKEDRL